MSAMRDRAAERVANNWRIRRRLPRITMYAIINGFIKRDVDQNIPNNVPVATDKSVNSWLF